MPTKRPEKLLLTDHEAAAMLGIGRTMLLQRTYSGEIPSIKIGRLRRYSVEALRDWIRAQSDEAEDEAA